MRFRPAPGWPEPPSDWIPDPGWKPDASWPAAPTNWKFWVNDYGVPISAPAGLYGAKERRISSRWLTAGIGLVALFLGIGMGASGGDASSTETTALALAKTAPTVTSTVTLPATTVTSSAPAETVTSTATVKSVKTVTKTATKTATKTITKTVDPSSLGLVGDGNDSASGGGSIYYDTCSDARAAGDTPLYAGDPGYSSHLDRDGDGVACE